MNADADLLNIAVKTSVSVQEVSSAELPANKAEDLLEQNAEELSKSSTKELPDEEKQTAMNDYYFEVGF